MAMEPELRDRLPAIWMIAAALCFATMGALAHALGPRCDWLLIALIRILCTFVFSVELTWIARARLVLWTPRTLWIRSVSGTIGLICMFYAFTRLPVADVLTLTNTYPLWIVVLSLRHLSRAELMIDLLCVLSGVAGVVLIQRPYLSGKGDVAVLVALARFVHHGHRDAWACTGFARFMPAPWSPTSQVWRASCSRSGSSFIPGSRRPRCLTRPPCSCCWGSG